MYKIVKNINYLDFIDIRDSVKWNKINHAYSKSKEELNKEIKLLYSIPDHIIPVNELCAPVSFPIRLFLVLTLPVFVVY